MIYGLDHLALAKYPKIAARTHPDGWAVGAFSNTFGDVIPALKMLLDTGRCPLVRLQLDWMDSHVYSGRFEAIRKEAIRVAAFARQYPHIDWRLSGACEHKLGLAEASKLRDIVLKAAPFATYVNTPMPGGAFLPTSPQCINESHGVLPKTGRVMFSFDGTDCVDADVEGFKSKFHNAETFFFWTGRFNLKWSANDTTARALRNAKPTKELIESVIALKQSKGPTDLPKGWILKSHAERHNQADVKGDKPCLIAAVKGSEAVLKAANGKVVERLKYFGTYDGSPKGFRYYSKTMGYLLSEKAMDLAGSPVVSVTIGGKVWGHINPAFRENAYR